MSKKFLFVDLFCGAGGVSTGVSMLGEEHCKVIAAVNHDPLAIESHSANHVRTHHFTEDIRLMNLGPLKTIIADYQQQYPDHLLVLWASLECTNHSKAKGGRPREADSRTLAWDFLRYVKEIHPPYVLIENVVEFMAWGDLDENGKPVSKNAGKEYYRWKQAICNLGYKYSNRIINSADFGAYTSRERYFGCFARPELPITWPEPEYSKPHKKQQPVFASKKWKPVRELLNLNNTGESIFTRKKSLVDNSLDRILRGLKKFGPKEKELLMLNNTPGYCVPVDTAAPTLTTTCHQSLITYKLMEYYGNGKVLSVDKPAPTITTVDRNALLSIKWINYDYKTGYSTDLEAPLGTITTVPKAGLVCATWITDPSFKNVGRSVDQPCPTIIASQKSYPLGLATAFYSANPSFVDNPADTEKMRELKAVCRALGVGDIHHRMLTVPELLKIQGFPDTYKLAGTQEIQKKHIGNSVVPVVAQRILEALSNA